MAEKYGCSVDEIKGQLKNQYDGYHFSENMLDIYNAMFYQSGYLTIKGYDIRGRMYTLDFPNDEVRRGFAVLLANSYFKKRKSKGF